MLENFAKKILFSVLMALVVTLFFLLVSTPGNLAATAVQLNYNALHLEKQPARPVFYRVGEKIVYDVRLGRVSLGKARFHHLALTHFNNKQAHLFTFETKLAQFSDLEKIYSDAESFLPLKVERLVVMWPRKTEHITEEYDQSSYVLRISKRVNNREEKTVITRQSPIHNAILLPYHLRNIPGLSVGWSYQINLPTQQFEMKLVSIEDLKVPAGNFKAYRFESTPKKFEIWLSADERRIPLKIKGMGTIGYTMVMQEHSVP
jgi:hypothetical protein